MGTGAQTFVGNTVVYCTTCNRSEPATIVSCDDGVFLRKACPKGAPGETKVAADVNWYMDRATRAQEVRSPSHCTPSQKGCPLDCGPCELHANDIHLPVFSITNDCNLDCPICFTHNRPDQKYLKSVDETKTIVEQLLRQKNQLEVINLTGGEPTMHPAFFDIIDACKSASIRRITVNTNGLRIASDREFATRVKESGIQMVLSLNTFDSEKSVRIHGRDIVSDKLSALKAFEELDIPITILMVGIKQLNEMELPDIAASYLQKPFVKNVVIQNMTFTGANGSQFAPRQHITIDEVESALDCHPSFQTTDFFPLGSAHPLCYSVAYYICCNERLVSLTRLIDRERLIEMSAGSYLLSPGADLRDEFMDGIIRLWAEGEDPEVLSTLKRFIGQLYPSDRKLSSREREELAGGMIKTVYIHSHMDADNFDLDRVSRCADIVPDESGAMVPACAYNLIYREQDERFWKK